MCGHVLETVVVNIGAHVDRAKTRRVTKDLSENFGHYLLNLIQSCIRHWLVFRSVPRLEQCSRFVAWVPPCAEPAYDGVNRAVGPGGLGGVGA